VAGQRASKPSFILPWPDQPMLARPIDELPDVRALPGGCLFEPKWDGYRGVIGVGSSGAVRIRSRRGSDLTTAFPDIATAVGQQVPPGTILDGELVVWDGDRLNFGQLHRRMVSPAQASRLAKQRPASFVAFDVLAVGGRTLADEPLRNRRRALEGLLSDLSPPVQVTPATRDDIVAAHWLEEYAQAQVGIEGLMIKGLAEPYRPGRRDWLKLRARDTAEAVVGAVTGTRSRPERLILGLPDQRRGLIVAGSTGQLKPSQQKEVSELLVPARTDHPWPNPLPAGRLGAWGREALDVVLVDPVLVVEIATDGVHESGHWRHLTRFIRVRAELQPQDLAPLA
jgi:ATP-dependent DNA ligase